MKLKDIGISRQLSAGMGGILLFVILLGFIAQNSALNLWANTKVLYDHSFTVQKAVGEIRDNILFIRLEMKEMILEQNDQEILLRIRSVNRLESDIFHMIDVLNGSYEGSKSDVDSAFDAILTWKLIRDETIRLLQTGLLSEALQSVTFDGPGEAQAQKVLNALDIIDRVALKKATDFYVMTEQQKNIIVMRFGIAFGIILLISSGIILMLRKTILTPLAEMTAAVNGFQQGEFGVRSRYESANDFGRLSSAFNNMLETIQAEMQNRDNVVALSAAMMLQDDMHGFCREMLTALVSRTGSQTGAVYLLNGKKSEFVLFESIGLQANARTTFSAGSREVEFGLALETKQIQHLADIPAETLLSYSDVSGEPKPREVWTIPVRHGDEIIAMVSLSSIRRYPGSAGSLMRGIWEILNARMNSALMYRKINEFSERLKDTNIELDAQARELALQAAELKEQNIELEVQKQMLDESGKLKSTFLSTMSHELRTPLNSVIALASVLNRRLRDVIPHEEHSYLEVIERNGRVLLSLVNDILDISRIEAAKEELFVTRFSMRELVDDLLDMIGPQAREKGISLKNLVSDTLPDIASDLSKCQRILQNLIGNAIKFTDAGSVEIYAMLMHECMQISVYDTGIGVDPGQIRFIFDEFMQVDDSASRKNGGSGLGLAIARKYARLLRGDITVISSPGKGSTFMLRLPLNAYLPDTEGINRLPADRAAGVKGLVQSHGPHAGKPLILVVEDNPDNLVTLKAMLGETCEIIGAADGQTGIDVAKTHNPAMILLDISLPVKDGFQVFSEIRNDKELRRIPIIALTARAMKGDREDILSYGFDGYVSKPLDEALLNKAMKGILHGIQAD